MLREVQVGERRLVDLFTGGLAVPLGLEAGRAHVNDFNGHLINVYSRTADESLRFDWRQSVERPAYERTREEFNQAISRQDGDTSPRQAARFLYLMRTCWNGKCQFNKKGGFSTSYGFPKPNALHLVLDQYPPQMRDWTFSRGDFGDVELRPGDAVYADPPYDETWDKYTPGGFGYEQQVRLVTMLAEHDGPVAISNALSPHLYSLYRRLGFRVDLVSTRHTLGGGSTKASKGVAEIFATKGLRFQPKQTREQAKAIIQVFKRLAVAIQQASPPVPLTAMPTTAPKRRTP